MRLVWVVSIVATSTRAFWLLHEKGGHVAASWFVPVLCRESKVAMSPNYCTAAICLMNICHLYINVMQVLIYRCNLMVTTLLKRSGRVKAHGAAGMAPKSCPHVSQSMHQDDHISCEAGQGEVAHVNMLIARGIPASGTAIAT